MIYLLFVQGPCPACGGDGWKIDDDKDRCPECDGDGWKYSQVATVPEPVAQVLMAQFGEKADAKQEILKTN